MGIDPNSTELPVSFLECTQCHGFGYAITPGGTHVVCSLCNNKQSVIGFIDSDLLYWGKKISPAAIIEKKLEVIVDRIINTILIIIGVAGAAALIMRIVELNEQSLSFTDLLIQPSNTILVFWISLLADLFIYYRIERSLESIPEITQDNKLSTYEYGENLAQWKYWQTVDNRLKIDVSKFFKTKALNLVDQAYSIAAASHHAEVRPSHLLLALLQTDEIASMFFRLEVNTGEIVEVVQRIAQKENEKGHYEHSPDFGAEIRKAVLLAYAESRIQKRRAVGVVELLIGAVLADPLVQDALFDREIDMEKLRNLVHWNNLVDEMMMREKQRRKLSRGKPKTIMNRAMTARPTKYLDAASQDFTLMAKSNIFMAPIGRDKEIAEAFRVLQEGHSSVMLVGPSGVGKTTILQGVANLMTSENVPGPLQDKRLVVTDPGAIIAGAAGIGGLEQRMQQIIQDIILAGNIIWAIEDIHTLLGAGSTDSSIDIGKILMNYISQGYIKVLGTTTTPEFQKYIENQQTFLRRFQIVQVPELSVEDSIKVLEGRTPYIEGRHKVFFTYDALVASASLTDRLMQDRYLPAKAVDILEETAVYVKETRGMHKLVRKQDVQQVMSEKTNVAIQAISESEADKLLNLESILHNRVIGQEEAINAISRALRRAREDIRDTTRPISSFLFLGPTGVGKTETAKAIAEAYFGSERSMMRFDMSEYQSRESMTKLIGATGQQGQLTEAVRKTPYGIILLDELEKAHGDIVNLFLQVMEDGRLTDGTGRTADFTNALIIATSNAGTALIQQQYKQGATSEGIKQELLDAGLLSEIFRPELLNRFDHIAVFTPLSPEELYKVCDLLLAALAKTLEQKGISLRWTTEAVEDLVKRGYDPVFGARPLRRLIQDTAQDAIAKLLLSKQLSRRDIVELHSGGEVEVIKADRI